ncbi:hypothetical protein SUDANB106_02524 [Streptomyces sp. enrichment culture]|uniref:hypothetical protein n=1 Tax=Streptomyces sp. enrichment culture TaxID=1795815 RepID=UPI003F5616BC
MVARPVMQVEVTPRELPFTLIGGGVAISPTWAETSPTTAVAVELAAFMIAFQVRIRLAWSQRS